MMNTLLKSYFSLPHDRSFGFFSKVVNRLVARILKRVLDRTVPKYFLKTISKFPVGINQISREKKVIISFTSFPNRIEDVWIVVECLFRQSYKADKIILWLSKPQFEGIELPKKLLDQQVRGLEIRFVDDDLKSHKKYLYAFESFPNDYVITVDDDLYYDDFLIENLVLLKNKYPNDIPTNRAHQISFDKGKNINKYSKWFHNYTGSKPSFFIVQTGGYGTLYTKEDFHTTYNNIEIIKDLIPHADDLWLKTQTLLMSKQIVTNSNYNKDPITIKKSQLEKLVTKNVINGGNDTQLRAVFDHFKLGNLEKYHK